MPDVGMRQLSAFSDSLALVLKSQPITFGPLSKAIAGKVVKLVVNKTSTLIVLTPSTLPGNGCCHDNTVIGNLIGGYWYGLLPLHCAPLFRPAEVVALELIG